MVQHRLMQEDPRQVDEDAVAADEVKAKLEQTSLVVEEMVEGAAEAEVARITRRSKSQRKRKRIQPQRQS